jgi:DtxR family Mn-dependent transcriptional regulator
MLSAAAEDYLKTIYNLRSGDGDEAVVTTQALANRLRVAAPSATAMVKKLARLKLVSHTPYRGVELTAAGQKVALEVIRHHRLIETYLAEVLGLEWDKIHEEAERLEHVLSEEVEAKMAAALNHPTHDPHGAPIPTPDGQIAEVGWERLTDVSAGMHATVRCVNDHSGELLRHLRDVDLVPGARIEVLRAVQTEGVLHLLVNSKRHVVGVAPASEVFVETDEE